MDINQKAKELANNIKNTREFKNMNKAKLDLEKNKSMKRKLDNYINKKNDIYSNYRLEEASIRINKLNEDHSDFFNLQLVSNYMNATRDFNSMMEKIYKTIERELLK